MHNWPASLLNFLSTTLSTWFHVSPNLDNEVTDRVIYWNYPPQAILVQNLLRFSPFSADICILPLEYFWLSLKINYFLVTVFYFALLTKEHVHCVYRCCRRRGKQLTATLYTLYTVHCKHVWNTSWHSLIINHWFIKYLIYTERLTCHYLFEHSAIVSSSPSLVKELPFLRCNFAPSKGQSFSWMTKCHLSSSSPLSIKQQAAPTANCLTAPRQPVAICLFKHTADRSSPPLPRSSFHHVVQPIDSQVAFHPFH